MNLEEKLQFKEFTVEGFAAQEELATDFFKEYTVRELGMKDIQSGANHFIKTIAIINGSEILVAQSTKKTNEKRISKICLGDDGIKSEIVAEMTNLVELLWITIAEVWVGVNIEGRLVVFDKFDSEPVILEIYPFLISPLKPSIVTNGSGIAFPLAGNKIAWIGSINLTVKKEDFRIIESPELPQKIAGLWFTESEDIYVLGTEGKICYLKDFGFEESYSLPYKISSTFSKLSFCSTTSTLWISSWNAIEREFCVYILIHTSPSFILKSTLTPSLIDPSKKNLNMRTWRSVFSHIVPLSFGSSPLVLLSQLESDRLLHLIAFNDDEDRYYQGMSIDIGNLGFVTSVAANDKLIAAVGVKGNLFIAKIEEKIDDAN